MTAQNGVNTALTRPAMAVFGKSAVVSSAFKKQFYKELQTPFLIENNNINNRTTEIKQQKIRPCFQKTSSIKRQDFTVECRRGYKYENSQHLEISRIYVNGKCPYPRAKMNRKCPTPRAQKTGKSPTLSRGGTLGDSLDTSINHRTIVGISKRIKKMKLKRVN